MAKKGSKQGIGHVYQRRTGGNYYFQYQEDGQRRTVALKTRNQKTAIKKATALREEMSELKTKEAYLSKVAEGRRLIKASAVKLKVGWQCYLEAPDDDKPNSSAGTLGNHGRHYKEFVDWMKVHYPNLSSLSDAITVEIAKEYWQYLKNKGFSPSTLNYKRTSLQLIFRVLKIKAGLTANVWQEIPRAQATKRGMNGLDATQAKRRAIPFYDCVELLKIFDDLSFTPMHKLQMSTLFTIGIYTGLRLIDAVHLKWLDIKDVTGGRVIELFPQKTMLYGKRVVIPVTPQLQVALEQAKIDNVSDFIVPDVVERYERNPTGVKRDCLKVFRQAGYTTTVAKGDKQRVKNIASVGFHSLRSSIFSYLAGRGLTVEKLAEISGDSIRTLSRYYLKSEQAALAQSVRDAMNNDRRLSDIFEDTIDVPITEKKEELHELEHLISKLSKKQISKVLNFTKEVM
jgi:integrase